MATAIRAEGLRKRYGELVAVDDVSFEVAEGETFGLLGPNGSGKTTTVECLQGLRHPDAGLLEVFGHDPRTDPRGVRRLTGSQLQELALPERIKVWEALRPFSVIDSDGRGWEHLLVDWGSTDRRNAAFGTCPVGSANGFVLGVRALVERGLEPVDLRVEQPGLEDAYLALTEDAPDLQGPHR